MRRLFLLRHGKSSWDDPSLDDFDRPLADRGRAAAQAMGSHMAASGWVPDLVLCSAAARARGTYEHLQAAHGATLPVLFEPSLYEATSKALLRRLQAADDAAASLLLIGHNPAVERLAGSLADDGDAEARRLMAAKFPTAALAVFRCEVPSWGALQKRSGLLEAFVRPRDLPAEKTGSSMRSVDPGPV